MTQWVKMSAAEIWLSNTMSAHLKAMRMMRARTLIFSGHLTAQYPSLGPCFNEGVILTFKFDYEPNFSFFLLLPLLGTEPKTSVMLVKHSVTELQTIAVCITLHDPWGC